MAKSRAGGQAPDIPATMKAAAIDRFGGPEEVLTLHTLPTPKPGRQEVIFIEQFRALIPGGLDAVLALAGGDALEQCLDHMRAGGRVAYPNGVEPEPRRRRGVRLTAYNAEAGPREFGRLEHAGVEAKLRVLIAAVRPLSQAAKVHVCHSEQSEESRPEYFQGNARSFVACGSSG